MRDTDFYLGQIRLQVLNQARREPISGLGISRELARHGYELGPGPICPRLHRLEEHGHLKSRRALADGRHRRLCRATPVGKELLAGAKTKVRELFEERIEEDY